MNQHSKPMLTKLYEDLENIKDEVFNHDNDISGYFILVVNSKDNTIIDKLETNDYPTLSMSLNAYVTGINQELYNGIKHGEEE